MNYNALSIEAYTSSTNRLPDPGGELTRAEGIRYRTGYPGGLFLDASFFVPRNILRWWGIQGAQRIVIRNGLKLAYEGWITNLGSILDGTAQGMRVTAVGGWGRYLMNRYVRKVWSDQRYTDPPWVWGPLASGAEKCTFDRYSRLRFTPKNVAWSNGEAAAVRYDMPAGETIKRILFDYNLQDGGQAWELRLRDNTGGVDLWSVTSSGSGSAVSVTLATPRQSVSLQFYARADQTPPADGTVYGEISNVTVYSHTGTVDVSGVAQSCLSYLPDLNSTTDYINSNGYWISPFMTGGGDSYEPWSDVLTRAAAFGDANYDRWAVQMLESELVGTPNGKPILAVSKFPVLTNYDYAISLDDENLIAPVEIGQNFDSIRNFIIVSYRDGDGKTQWISPEDDTTLKDTDSINTYGQRDLSLNLGHISSSMAINAGRRALAARKDPQYQLSAPIQVKNYIRTRGGGRIPASEIRAGKRLRVENFLQDLSGTGLTFILSQSDYDDDRQICSVQTGIPDDLVMPKELRFIQKPPARSDLDDLGPIGDGDTVNNPGNTRRRWWEDTFRDLGWTESPWAGNLRDRSKWREKP